MKLVHASLNGGKGLESNFRHCGGPRCRKKFSVKLVRAPVSTRKGLEDNFTTVESL